MTHENNLVSYGPWYAMLSGIPDLAREVGECVASGERLVDIARRFGVSRGQMKLWLDGDEGRRRVYEAGLSALVDERVMDALERNGEIVEVADGATGGEGCTAKVRMDGRDRYIKNVVLLAGKLDRGRFGERVDVRVEMGLDLRVVLEAARGRVYGVGDVPTLVPLPGGDASVEVMGHRADVDVRDGGEI